MKKYRVNVNGTVYEVTVDSVQLTVMVSLRDGLKNILIHFRRKFPNCQLSIVNCQLISSAPPGTAGA